MKTKMNLSRGVFMIVMIILGAGLFSCKKIDASKGEKKWYLPFVSSDFEGIEFAVAGNITYNASSTTSVEIYTTEKVFNAIDIVVEDNKLKVRLKSGYTIKNGSSIQVIVNAPSVRNFFNSGSGNFTVHTDPQSLFTSSKLVLSGSGSMFVNQLNSYSENIVLSGSGDIEIDHLECAESEVNISGSGSIVINGQTNNSDISISGSGSINAFEFVSDISETLISGSGVAEIYADSLLNVSISGSGKVYYKGAPSVNFSGSGSGSVINAN